MLHVRERFWKARVEPERMKRGMAGRIGVLTLTRGTQNLPTTGRKPQ